jgi:hypothetical protein
MSNKYKNPNYMKEYMEQRKRERRALLREKLGNVCQRCASPDNLVLTFKDGNAPHRISWLWGISHRTFMAQIPELELLCRRCWWEKLNLLGRFHKSGPKYPQESI